MKIRNFARVQSSMIISLVLHIILGIIMMAFIKNRAEPEEEFVKVEWVPPPPVEIKPRRSMPREIPKIKIGKQKTPSKSGSKTARRSAHEIAEVIEQSPDIVRESVEINRDAKISDVLPLVTTTAEFDTEAETHETISAPRATPKMVETPGAGRKSDRVRAAGKSNYQGLADTDIFGKGRQYGGVGTGSGIGDEFADIGTEVPKYVNIEELQKENPEDIFGIGKYVDEGREEKKDQDVVYVLDASSSMRGRKLEIAKHALKDALAMLRENDKFNIIVFNNHARLYSDTILSVSQATLKQSYSYLDSVRIHTGTNLSEALEMALELSASTIVVISDGDPSRGITNTGRLLSMVRDLNGSEARIMAIGIGRGHSSEGIRLLTKLARQNDGEIRLIDLNRI